MRRGLAERGYDGGHDAQGYGAARGAEDDRYGAQAHGDGGLGAPTYTYADQPTSFEREGHAHLTGDVQMGGDYPDNDRDVSNYTGVGHVDYL